MGEWFASALVGKLVDKICSYMENQYAYKFGAEDKLRQLKYNLKNIQTVMDVAEARQIKHPRLKEALRELKNAAYHLDDLLDKFNFKILQDKVWSLNQVRGHYASCSFTTVSKRARTAFAGILFSDEDLNELMETSMRFDKIYHDMLLFIKLVELDVDATKQEETLDWRQTTSISSRSEVFGRDNEIDSLIKLLLEPCDAITSNTKNFSVVSIVGIGGVGKTTLAQAAYNDQRVMDRFDLRAWVYISEKFDVKRITVEIIESASINTPRDFQNIYNLDKIQFILREGLVRKKFLIVLDDVWNEVSSKWKTLSKPFPFGKEGSRIVITTRNQRVADMMETKGILKLEGLEDEEYGAFFTKCAFGDEDPWDHPKLLLIGQKIAKKLLGSPLAAKTIGSALKSNFEEEHWRRILASKLWQVEQNEDDILPALRLSYEHLPMHLKQCFAYCSLFPKDHCFEKDSLVQMWMAHGFIQPDGERRFEDIGRAYIDDLCSRFFFHRVVGGDNKVIIHDLLHDLSELVFKGEHFRIENDFAVEIPKGVRHLYVYTTNLLKVYDYACQTETLRSLVVSRECHLPRNNFEHVFEETLKKLRSLRVLVFHNCPLHILPEAIGDLLHLRYVEIQSSNGVQMPNSLCRLYYLQGLSLQITNLLSDYSPLPEGVKDLINLRHLKTDPKLVTAISGIGRLTSLQELEEFHVKKVKGFQIEELSKLRQLRGQLCIKNLEHVSSKMEALSAELHNKEHLKKLSFFWGHINLRDHNIPRTKDKEILEGFRPHQNLVELSINRYTSLMSPSWLEKSWTSNLESIELSHCYYWKVLPPFGELPFLRVLHLSCMTSVEHLGVEFYGKADPAFPLLQELSFDEMFEWRDWSVVESGRDLFPSLGKLRISHCSKLKGPLPMPTSPRQFAVMVSDKISPLPAERKLFKKKDSTVRLIADRTSFLFHCLPATSLAFLHRLEITSSLLTTFTPEQEEWFQHLISLRHLNFLECNGLCSLPAELRCLASLETLCVKKCPKIKSLPENGLPAALKELHIADCHRLLKERCNWRDGVDWLKISHVQTITIDGNDGTGSTHSLNQLPP